MKRTTILVAILAAAAAASTVSAVERSYTGGKWVTTAQPDENTPAGMLVLAREHLAEGRPAKALKLARKIFKKHPDHPACEEALNIAGQAEMDRRHYWKAYQWYEKQASRYPVGPLYERAMHREAKIAEIYLAGRKRLLWGFLPISMTEDALEMLDSVVERLPGSSLAERCLMLAGDFLYDAGRWEEAVDTYVRYGELFRGRYRSQEAELKAAKATYNRFLGVAYDDTPLLEAEQRFRAYLARYPMAADRDKTVATLEEIENLRARKDYETARFYERIGRKPAAAFYDRQVVRLYPGTDWAAKSRRTLGEAPAEAENEATKGNTR